MAILKANLASDMLAFRFDHRQHIYIRKGMGQIRLASFPLERKPFPNPKEDV